MPIIFGAPFQPTSKYKIKKIIKLASAKKGDKILDLGSGDGRIVMSFAKKGLESHGYEINPLLVFISRRKIRKENLQDKAFIHWGNFWKENIDKYDVIILFQIGYIMNKLENKIKKEAKKNVKIISHDWKFPNLKISKKISKIYLYKIRKKIIVKANLCTCQIHKSCLFRQHKL